MFLTVCLNPTIQKTLRFSSIVSGTVNRAASHRLDVSGKGINVTRVLTQLGKKALHLTQLGGVMRPLFLSLCEQDRLSIEWAESESPIRFCYTLLENDNRAGDSGFFHVTELVEESEPVAAGTENRLLEKYFTLLEKDDFTNCLIISGTKAAGFSDTVIPSMAQRAKEKGLRVILDIRGNDLLNCLEYEPDIIKPNLYEFAATFTPQLVKDNDFKLDDNDQGAAKEIIKSAVMDITQKYKCNVILTNGSRKIMAANKDKFFEVDVQPVKTVNSIGCGDAFTAGLAAAFDDGADFNAAIFQGIRCGALNAGLEKPGCIAGIK